MEVSTAQLRVFIAVATQRNFTRAAENLYMAQPSVSAVIAKLEQTLGQVLFEQIGKKVCLTEAGEILLDYAKRILDLSEETDEALKEFEEPGAGRLLLGASNTIGIYLLPAAIARFKQSYPKVSVFIGIGNTNEIEVGLLSNRLDFGLVAGCPEHQDLRPSHFLRDKLVLIVPAGHPRAREGAIKVADLAQEPFIIRERAATTRSTVERELKRLGVAPKVTMEVANNEAVKQAVAAGIGVSIVSELTIAPELALGSIAKLEIEGATFERDFYLVVHKDKHCSPTVREFLNHLRAAVAALPYASPIE